MKGLTMRLAGNEEEALNMLFEVCMCVRLTVTTTVGLERLVTSVLHYIAALSCVAAVHMCAASLVVRP